jgi:hypothetical protein
MTNQWWVNRPDGLLVVRRSNVNVDEGLSIRPPAVPLTHDLVEKRYRGIEGEPWPQLDESGDVQLVDGLAPLEQLSRVKAYYDRLPSGPTYDLVYCQFGVRSETRQELPEQFVFCGYDYGFYGSEWSVYSVIFNEVVYGLYSSMQAFAKLLNECLLLPSYDVVQELERIRNHMLSVGSDLEQAEICRAISIYAPPR